MASAPAPTGNDAHHDKGPSLRRRLMRLRGRELLQTVGPVVLLCALAVFATLHFARPAPPHTLTMATGPAGSTFDTMGQRYQKILARSGIRLRLQPSQGSLDNLAQLGSSKSSVDIALVQSGVAPADETSDLVSLGTIFYEPLAIFYRSERAISRLSELSGSRIAVGAEGSGSRFLALVLLKANGIVAGERTTLVNLEGDAARRALLHHDVDAIFLAGDSASAATIREMLHAPGVRLFDFAQADAYLRRFPYLNKLTVPAGAFDLGENLPSEPTNVLAPTVELIARPTLHPALSDLMIEAAIEIHSRAGVLQNAGQFPTPVTHDFPLSADAARYYKSGKSFMYRYLPFWLASLINRLIVLVVPILIVAVPGLRFLPELYNWRVRRRIHQRYVQLMALERQALGELTAEQRKDLLARLDHVEQSVIRVRVPGSHANQLYVLREHIHFVRKRLTAAGVEAGAASSV